MGLTPQTYGKMSEQAAPKSNTLMNVIKAYIIGGGICMTGQVFLSAFEAFGFGRTDSGAWTSIILVAASAVATGFGWYEKLAKHGGAGTLVPITGFANAISSSAIESQSEGLILGVGAKIFTIAGPVILYGTAASVIYGILFYIVYLVRQLG
ncbi:MAG: SpoVA/SpoVAEb family sporulation membrane protein [Ruminococcus sp.]|nr:SpoVA/SpoVAEb family sporulation membrane protein [Ruminococcus sp.]